MEVYKYKYNIHFCIHFPFLSYTLTSPASLTGLHHTYNHMVPRIQYATNTRCYHTITSAEFVLESFNRRKYKVTILYNAL